MTGKPRGKYNVSSGYRACLDVGMSISETAKKLGVSRHIVNMWERRNGVRFLRNDSPLDAMTPSQLADYETYVKAHIPAAEAIAKATAPRVKIRAVPKGMGAK